MSEPSIVVLPVSGSGPHPDQEKAEKPEHPGPFKQILAHPDSFYKYVNWEDPIRNLALYLGATSILFGAHYLPLTQIALKAGVTTLGVVSVTEFASRSFSGNSLSTRLRPKEYKTIPESTLNATLKDMHDLIQYAVVQAQRIVFGQDLDKTFATFLGFFVLFWLTKMLSSFWFAVMALTSIFVAPLISSEQGRRAAHDASVRAQELANVTAEKGRELGQDGKVKAAELSSKGKQTAADLSAQTRDTTSDMFGTATENIKRLLQVGKNTVNETEGIASSTHGNAKGYISDPPAPPSNHTNGHSDGNRSVTNGASNEVPHVLNGASEITERTAPGVNTGKEPYSDRRQYPVSSLSAYTSNMNMKLANQTSRGVHNGKQPDPAHLQHPVSYLPAHTDDVRTGAVTDTGLKYTAAGHAAATHDMASRPHDAVQVTMEKA
ncbi:unnamed protein product [Alternaria alternata]